MSKQGRQILDRRQHPLWSNEEATIELSRLTAILFSFDRLSGEPLTTLVTRFEDHALKSGRTLPDDGSSHYAQIRRLIGFETLPNDARLLDALADYVLGELKTRQGQGKAKYLSRVLTQIDLERAFRDYCEDKLQQPVEVHYGFQSSRASSRNHLGPLEVSLEQFVSASEYLTGCGLAKDADAEKAITYYACYRYSVIVGHIAKSEIRFRPPCSGDPVLRFENRFRESGGNRRDSSGIAFRNGRWIFLIGQLNGEHALKVLAISAGGETVAGLAPALLMSKSVKPFVGRAALVRTDAPLTDSELRVSDEATDKEFSSKDFRTRVAPHIKNSMLFRLPTTLLYRASRKSKLVEYTQPKMVQLLPDLIRGEFFTRNAEGKLTPFNPASHEHYTFNQAIEVDTD